MYIMSCRYFGGVLTPLVNGRHTLAVFALKFELHETKKVRISKKATFELRTLLRSYLGIKGKRCVIYG